MIYDMTTIPTLMAMFVGDIIMTTVMVGTTRVSRKGGIMVSNRS